MSWTPYDHEAEERRDSERFADASVFDGPDPSEYMETPENEVEAVEVIDITPTYIEAIEIYPSTPKPGMIDENAMLKGLLGMLFAILASLMLWILIGAAVMRWVL
jgi:hypothetical protein